MSIPDRLDYIRRLLRSYAAHVCHVQRIAQARCPVLRFCHKQQKIFCELSINNQSVIDLAFLSHTLCLQFGSGEHPVDSIFPDHGTEAKSVVVHGAIVVEAERSSGKRTSIQYLHTLLDDCQLDAIEPSSTTQCSILGRVCR